MRTPSELMELCLQYENFDQFAETLSYEEVSMVCMTIELLMRMPSTIHKKEMYESALEYFIKARKKMIERN